jgi:prepilin-type N-terminal cleavage/methylation domain-containing protein
MRSTESHAPDGAAGFTLLETLTALTILAIAFVSLFEAHAAGLRAAGTAADSTRTRSLAQSLLAEASSGRERRPASRSGRDGRFAWTIDVEEVHAPWAEITSQMNWRLHHIRVAVLWDKSRRIALETLKLGRADE